MPTDQQIALEDIITPVTVSAWPPAIGWWLLLGLLIITMIGAMFYIRRHRQKWGYRNFSLRLLKQNYHQWQQQEIDDNKACYILLALLKRTAITAYPTRNIAALQGNDWVHFLNQQVTNTVFDDNLQRLICEQQYQNNSTIDIDHLYTQCQKWIKQHKIHVNKVGAHV